MAQPSHPLQGTLDELGTPLALTTFVVVDLETTGSRPDGAGITEIGAVKIRGGEVLGEFGSLVDPRAPVPPFVTLLTGITQAMVDAAPPAEEALPAFLEFAGFDSGSVLVAHNAPFDVGFLKAACAAHTLRWPNPAVLDTLPLARRLVSRQETANHKLGTLAGFFGVADEPTHRALDDARATVGVLRGLLGRLGARGVGTWEELRSFRSAPTPVQRGKRHLADGVPAEPGVYVFEDASGAALYVGKSGDLRTRVRSYFTASETRSRIREMVGLAERVTPIVCGTALEAEVRELRLIAERKPPYNRRSRNPERAPWLELTTEAFPRLSVVRRVRDGGARYLGPFPSVRVAELARDALHQTFPIRRCAHRITPARRGAACALAGMGLCGAPCEGAESPEEYAAHADAVARAMSSDVSPVVEALTAHIGALSRQLRYEEAALHRDRLSAFLAAAVRTQRLQGLADVPHLVAARPVGDTWELCVVRHGRLAASGRMRPGADPHAYLGALVASAETVPPGSGPVPRADANETECVLRWLGSAGTRLLELDRDWVSPANGAEKYLRLVHRHTPGPTRDL
nr:DEDD exonuclease domain-containing protein [Actinorugispora endophytica]